jgi:SAM-dependent methyltransferase
MKSVGELYKHPEEYDLEHLGDSDDIDFYVSLARKLKPRRILELGCGTGRITLPLAEEGARLGFEVVGLDSQSEMLGKAANRRLQAPPEVRERLALIEADMRVWRARLALRPCCDSMLLGNAFAERSRSAHRVEVVPKQSCSERPVCG